MFLLLCLSVLEFALCAALFTKAGVIKTLVLIFLIYANGKFILSIAETQHTHYTNIHKSNEER